MRILTFFFVFLFVSGVYAQEKRYQKALDYYLDENYMKAYKQLEKALAHPDTKNLPEVFLLQAKVLVALADDEKLLKKEPKPIQEALKFSEKALKKSKDPQDLRASEADFFQLLEDKALEKANEEMGKAKYNAAVKYYERLYLVNGSLVARWGEARVALALLDTVTALDKINGIADSVFARATDSTYKPPVPDEPFVLLINHYIQKKKYDTAAYLAEISADIYPRSAKLKGLLLKSFLLYVTQKKPDMSTLEYFASMRPRFRDDSLFVHKENVLFLYLLNTYSNQGLTVMADSLLSGFIGIKNSYYNEFGARYWKNDALYDPDNNQFLMNLIRYSVKFEREAFVNLLVRNYVSGVYADSAFRKLPAGERWKAYFKNVQKEHSIFLLTASIPVAQKELKKEKWFAAYKLSLIQQAFKEAGTFKDRTALLNFVSYALGEYPANKEIYTQSQKLNLSIIREYTDSSHFSHAQLAIIQYDYFFPNSAELRQAKRRFSEADFISNYYGSRLLKDTVNGKIVNEFVWNGDESNCDAGGVPVKVQDKVEQRINYFRRTARVPDYVQLVAEKNRQCQYAALLYQVNTIKKTVEPAESWRCYSPISSEAAQMSARVFGQTTVFAVTSVMADLGDDNISVGNRRWLLFPPAREMGHGSTSKVSVIWTLDETGKKDSSEYLKDFVSWPPRDFCPTMFQFERWNFSMYADLSKATVTLAAGKKLVAVKQEALVGGYGMPSLVWKPLEKLQDEVEYTVTIKNVYFHGDKAPHTITYTVTFIDPMKGK